MMTPKIDLILWLSWSDIIQPFTSPEILQIYSKLLGLKNCNNNLSEGCNLLERPKVNWSQNDLPWLYCHFIPGLDNSEGYRDKYQVTTTTIENKMVRYTTSDFPTDLENNKCTLIGIGNGTAGMCFYAKNEIYWSYCKTDYYDGDLNFMGVRPCDFWHIGHWFKFL